MAANQKQRFIVVGGVVLIVIVAMLAFFGANTATKVMTVAQAAQPASVGERVEVTGNVVNNSFDIQGDILTFRIADPDDPGTDLQVRYDRGVSATFGNGVTAICTGTIQEGGLLHCSELVTKCPSKYETATDALTVERLRGYGDAIVDKTVKVQGVLQPGSLKDAAAEVRFAIADASDPATGANGESGANRTAGETQAGGTAGTAGETQAGGTNRTAGPAGPAGPADATGSSGAAADAGSTSNAAAGSADAALPVRYQGALSDEVADGAAVVLLGALNQDGKFTATEVALEG